MESPKFFCALLEKLTDVVNALVHTSILVQGYRAITNIPETGPVLTHTLYNLTHIDCYMDDAITAVQGGLER